MENLQWKVAMENFADDAAENLQRLEIFGEAGN